MFHGTCRPGCEFLLPMLVVHSILTSMSPGLPPWLWILFFAQIVLFLPTWVVHPILTAYVPRPREIMAERRPIVYPRRLPIWLFYPTWIYNYIFHTLPHLPSLGGDIPRFHGTYRSRKVLYIFVTVVTVTEKECKILLRICYGAK